LPKGKENLPRIRHDIPPNETEWRRLVIDLLRSKNVWTNWPILPRLLDPHLANCALLNRPKSPGNGVTLLAGTWVDYRAVKAAVSMGAVLANYGIRLHCLDGDYLGGCSSPGPKAAVRAYCQRAEEFLGLSL
jgi:hypothetical protein